MKKIKHMAVYAVIIALVLTFFSSCGEQPDIVKEKPDGIRSGKTENSLIQVAQDGSTSLWFNPKNCEIHIKKDSYTYNLVKSEVPSSIEKNAVATELQSHLLVSYINDSNTVFNSVSAVSSVNRGTYKYELIKNGIKIIFDFSREREQFVIPVEYTIENNELLARICTKEIVEYGENRIFSISLLPGFFTGTSEENGQLFFPDGSGALLDFKVCNDKMNSVKLEVYGRDPALDLNMVATNTKQCRLPIYGMLKNGSSVLAVIEEGDSLAKIVVHPLRANIPVARIYSEFRYRAIDTVILADQSFKSTRTTISAVNPENTDFSVRFLFTNDKQDIETLAFAYRNYLTDKTVGNVRGIYVEAYGAVKKATSTVGIVYDKLNSVTDFDELEAMAKTLGTEDGAPITFLLKGFHSGGYGSGMTDDSAILGLLGGNKGLERFSSNLRECDKIYLGGCFSCDSTKSVFKEYARNLYNQVLLRNVYSKALFIKEDEKAQPLVKHKRTEKALESYIKSAEKLSLDGFYFNDIGNELYSDFDKDNTIGRNEAQKLQLKALKMASEYGDIAINGANAYAVNNTDAIIGVPTDSSKYLFETRSVPFVQIALSGVTKLAGEPLNDQSDIEATFIKNTALGMDIHIQLTGDENYNYKGTPIEHLYNTSFAYWQGVLEKYAARFSKVSKKIDTAVITAFESPSEGVYKVTYSNGTVILANANSEPYDFNGIKLSAYSLEVQER